MERERNEEYSRREFLKRYGIRLGTALLLAEGGSLAAPLVKQIMLGKELPSSPDDLNPNPYPSPYGSIVIPDSSPAHPSLLLPPSIKPTFTPDVTPSPEALPNPTPFPTPDTTANSTAPAEVIKVNASEIVWSGDKTKPYVYLTVDDCYDPNMVVKAMNAAEKAGIKLTFFPIGKNVAKNPGLFKEAYLRGHAIENHTWDHSWLSGKSASFISDEIRRQHDAVQNAIGAPYKQHFLRPPGGAGIFSTEHPNPLLPITAQMLGYKIAMWTADSNGWRMYPRTDAAAINYIMQNVNDYFFRGSIVLQHALPDDMIALPKIIAEAKQKGLRPITMPQGIK